MFHIDKDKKLPLSILLNSVKKREEKEQFKKKNELQLKCKYFL